MMQKTLAIIKPDAVGKGYTGKVIDIIEKNGFIINRMKKLHFTNQQAENFYSVHKGKPFFEGLITCMTQGPIIVLELEKENAIADWRKLMGTTNPAIAEPGTIRNLFGVSHFENVVHGSDSVETALQELKFFFH